MFHVVKQSRMYDGKPYCGNTSDSIPASYEKLSDAEAAVKKFTMKNPVGWNVYDADTKQLVLGIDLAYL